MAASSGTPPAGGDNRTVRVIVLVFLACFLAVAVWGAMVVSETRGIAERTDREVRFVAWLLLAAADRDGRFPPDEPALLAAAAMGIPESVAEGEGWPATALEAWANLPPPDADLAEILARVRVEFSRGEPPRVAVAGLPTRLRTLPLVNEWIAAYADAHRDALIASPEERSP